MAGVTAIALGLTAASAAIGTGLSISQAAEGRERQREAQKALDQYQRQELTNVYTSMTVPMEGYQMRERQVQQQYANQADMLSQLGARGVIGGAQQLMTGTNESMRAIQADLEQSQFRIQQMIAQDELRIQGMMETREQQDLAGIGQEISAGRQQYYSGLEGAYRSLGSVAPAALGYFGQPKASTSAGTTTGYNLNNPPTREQLWNTGQNITGGDVNTVSDIYNQNFG